MQPMEDDCEEVCIIDTILEEQANEQQVQDAITQELFECLEEQQEPQCMSLLEKKGGNSTFTDWRKGKGISTAGSQTPACGIKICIFGGKQAVSSCNIVTADRPTGGQSATPPQDEQASFGVGKFPI